MTILSVEEVLSLHELLIKRYGGSAGLRDRGLLESAVHSVSAAYDDTEVYPTVEEKAARLAFGLISNHAFVDGNKRIGVMAMLATLELNSIQIVSTSDELTDLGLGVAAGELVYEDILAWIKQHLPV